MKRQSSLFDNDVRVTPLEAKEIKSIRVKKNESKEYLTASNRVVIVTKYCKPIMGVGEMKLIINTTPCFTYSALTGQQ
jgi:hypothetical protein